MKKLIVILLVLATLFSVLSLTACELDESSSENGEGQQTADESSALKAEYDKIKAELEALNVLSDADKAKIAELEAALAALQKKYDEIAVNVTFSAGEGVSPIDSQTLGKGATATEPAAPSKEGFTFLGWYLNEEKFDFSTPITESITLTAKWEPQSAPPPPGIGGGNRPGGGGVESGWWDEIEYDPTTLRFKMTKNTGTDGLASGCERYMEGTGGHNDDIDKMISERNENALCLTNIEEVIYTYYSDDTIYNFSRTYDVMYEEISNPDLNSPDMYCNFAADMLAASLRGSFANLYSAQRGTNYFDFSDPEYMADIMCGLTLNLSKIYLVASDYFIDAFRSFYVIPVNVELYNSVVTDSLCADYDENEVLNIDDLFAQVKAGEWTYQKLMDYCAAVYKDTNTAVTDEDLQDTLGFALAQDDSPATALVYSSSVCIIEKTFNFDLGKLEYGYPGENENLYALNDAIGNLVNAKGVMCVTSNDAATVNVTGYAASVLSVRQQFTTGKMLFGGIVPLGCLEFSSYQEMKSSNGGGFGILPVPVLEKTDSYKTAMSNNAKFGAIANCTQKYSQCSAYLHYLSTNSADIINEYYFSNFTRDIVADLDGNVEMLQYMRSNARSEFDKLFEDVIEIFFASSDDVRWYTIIANACYDEANLRQKYLEKVGQKNENLDELEAMYNSLSN